MATGGSSRGDWLQVSMRTPGASREPSFQGSPACSPERETMAHVHESMPQALARSAWGVRDATLSCLHFGPNNTEADLDEANPRARFGDDISLDCHNDEPSDQALHRMPEQREAPVQPPHQNCSQQFLPSQVATRFVSQTPQVHPCSAPQLPLLGGGHNKSMQSDNVTQLPSLGRGASHLVGDRPSACHRQLHPAEQRRMAPSDAVQSCNYQTSAPGQRHEERGPAVQHPPQIHSSAVGLLPPVSHAGPQQSTNENCGGPPQLHSSSYSHQYAGQRACSDAGFHHRGAVLHDAGRVASGQRQFSMAPSLQHTNQQQYYRPYIAPVRSCSVCTHPSRLLPLPGLYVPMVSTPSLIVPRLKPEL